MADIFDLDQIDEALANIDPVAAIEEGFVAYSQGRVVVPPVAEMIFENPPGDVHIKYGYIRDDRYYVIKIASGHFENFKLNLPTNNGLMLLFEQTTGQLLSILLDEGHLTNVRTAAAGAVVAKYLAPKTVERIGIFGAGTQGRLQLEYLRPVIECKDVIVWGRNRDKLDVYQHEMGEFGFSIETTQDARELLQSCNLVITTTPAKSPLFPADMLRIGTHITAMGSDTPDKIEVDPKILASADIVVADSISQCLSRGEISQAIRAGLLNKEKVVELGQVISKNELQRTSDDQTTIADLTGVAVQDIQISKAVYEALLSNS